MSTSQAFVTALTSAIQAYSVQFNHDKPMPKHRAKDVQDLLEIIKQAAPKEGIINPLQLKADLLSRMEDMPVSFLGRLWIRLDYSDLRSRLWVVFEDSAYAQDNLLAAHLTELAAWAKQQGDVELSSRNQKLLTDIEALQSKVALLETENTTLKTENEEQLKQLQALRQQNVKLVKEIQEVAEKNHRLAANYQSSLTKVRGLEAENARLKDKENTPENPSLNKAMMPNLKM